MGDRSVPLGWSKAEEPLCLRGRVDAEVPSGTSSLASTALHDGWERSGGDGVWYVLFRTSLSLGKVPPVNPANLPRVTRRWHRSRWERGGGGEMRKIMLRSLRSPWFLFLVPLLMPSLQSPSKILSNLNYWGGRLFNTGKELKEKKSSADTSNEANVPSGFIPCLSGKKRNPSSRQRGYPRAPLLTRWEGWREDESWGKQKPEAEASRTGSII